MTYSTIEDAFLFVSSAAPCAHYAVIHRITGENYFASEYIGESELPDDITAHPHLTCKDKGWKGFRDWLGKSVMTNRFRGNSSPL